MFYAITLIALTQPASFEINVIAGKDAHYTMTLGGLNVQANKIYTTQPLVKQVKIKLIVRYLVDDVEQQEFTLELCPGNHYKININIPSPRVVKI